MHTLSAIIEFPLIGFILLGLDHLRRAKSGKKSCATMIGFIATGAMFFSFLASIYGFYLLKQGGEKAVLEQTLFQWIHLGALHVDFTLRLDALSSVFALVITGVGTLIHLYSVGYMHDDENVGKYFSYLNLFCFMMLNLVLGATLPHVFLGWEGVGLASYLLIGFWYQDPMKVLAGQKAFVMNRIGDLGFLIAMFLAFKFAGTLDLASLGGTAFSPTVATTFGLLIFFACIGKSAQIPLFTWLPDAMAGPTPVSALIHAATMVTSGIYLLARLNPIIASSEIVMSVIAITGAMTAFFSAIIACSQTDIKKILAYSTISQLGFMFLGCGVGAFDAGVFHVMTHAFFKALLFLAAGSVIHALSGEQEIFKMGGLRKKIPITFLTFTAGWAAILGLPPFSGFFSKDEIILQSLVSPHGSKVLFVIALASAFLTAFYMTRLYVLVFFGDSRLEKNVEKHVHESPLVMGIPLIVLGTLALIGGWFGAPVQLGVEEVHDHLIQYSVMAGSVLFALAGAWIAYQKYGKAVKEEVAKDIFGVDRFYGVVFGKGTLKLSDGAARFIEESIIQRSIKISTAVVDLSGNVLKITQVGSAQAYLMMILLSILGVVAWFYLGVGQNGKL